MNTIHLSLTNDDLENAIRKIIVNGEGKEDFVKIIHDLMMSNNIACSLLFKVVLGGKLPELPAIGATGYIKPESLNYSQDKTLYSKVLVQGYIPCKVVAYGAITDYCPITVELPEVGDATKHSNIKLEAFYADDELDIYDDLPI